MTQKQKIEQLEKEVAELKMRVQLLEARPMIITFAPQTQPIPASQPTVYPQPYYVDPIYPTVICQHQQNTASMSSQQTSFLQ
jgi:hypothetical protein